MLISEKLKTLRSRSKLTQTELANKIAITQSMVGEVESGRRLPSKKTARKLATFFNTPIDYWMSESEIDNYFENRKKYAMFDEVLSTLIKNGKIKDTNNIDEESWDLIKDAVKIEIKVRLMENEER